MNRRSWLSPLGPVAWIGILTGGWIALACGSPGRAGAQFISPEETGTGYQQKVRDYYLRYTDPATEALLRTVEEYHLAENFWQFYRRGEFNSARADLQYVLRNFPNHPRALHLIAYDENLKLEPSLVIQQFEIAIRSFPDHAYTYAQYGRYLIHIGRKRAGVELLNQALMMDPSLTVARAWRSEAGDVPSAAETGSAGRRPAGEEPSSGTGDAPQAR